MNIGQKEGAGGLCGNAPCRVGLKVSIICPVRETGPAVHRRLLKCLSVIAVPWSHVTRLSVAGGKSLSMQAAGIPGSLSLNERQRFKICIWVRDPGIRVPVLGA